MKDLKKIYIENGNDFATYLSNWAEGKSVPVEVVELKPEELIEQCDSLVIFHENHNIIKEYSDLRETFDAKHIPVHKIDINGTMVVAVSQFEIWLDRNKCKNILVLGDAELKDNSNIERFFATLKF